MHPEMPLSRWERQSPCRGREGPDFRGLAGQIDGLSGCSGMEVVVVLPGGQEIYLAADADPKPSQNQASARAALPAGALNGTKA